MLDNIRGTNGQKIKMARKMNHMTQKVLAKLLKISERHMCLIESDKLPLTKDERAMLQKIFSEAKRCN